MNKIEIIRVLSKIFCPGDVFEIRLLDAQTHGNVRPHVVSGYYNFENIEKAAEDLAQIKIYRGAYYTPNPVRNDLLARAANRLRDITGKNEPLTADTDILWRRWLLIDCDAERPSGISSSDEEHGAAIAKAQEIRDGLSSMGFTEPVMIDSGNGAQLMYRIDVPADDGNLLTGILSRLQSCNTDAVKIDRTVFNPARIWRLPGSMNCKGDSIAERPHRPAVIIGMPDVIVSTPRECLFELAGIPREGNGDGDGGDSAGGGQRSGAGPRPGAARGDGVGGEGKSGDMRIRTQGGCPENPLEEGERGEFPVPSGTVERGGTLPPRQTAAAPGPGRSADLSGVLAGVDLGEYREVVGELFNIDEWIVKYCPGVEGPDSWNGGRKWIFPVCPFNEAHTNRSAIITEQPGGAVGFTCHHNGCKDHHWTELRELLDMEYRERKDLKDGKDLKDRSGIGGAAVGGGNNCQLSTVNCQLDQDEVEIEVEPAPWRDVGNEVIYEVLAGTFLGEMAGLYAGVTVPTLPVEAALLKAIVTAGCALSEPGVPDMAKQGLLPPIGAQRAKLRINTAGGQVCNVYAMLAANSASGKDIGNLLDTVTTARNWNLGTSGSAEGIAEALKSHPNGLISISEFMNWLDEKHWQHKATSFLTEAFSKGFFRHNFSSRSGKGGLSSCDYCYPNIIANIQPEVFENVVRKQDISSGFMGRFIYARMPEFFGDPARINLSKVLERFGEILPFFQRKHGVLEVPEGYGRGLSDMFKAYSAPKLHPVWRRLVNEYMPRLAVMLSINSSSKSQGDYVLLEDCHWSGAEKMVQWFFSHAESMLMQVEDDSPSERQSAKIFKTILKVIHKYDRGRGVTTRTISQYITRSASTAADRQKVLNEMVERGWITCSESSAAVRGAVFKIKNVPPGIL